MITRSRSIRTACTLAASTLLLSLVPGLAQASSGASAGPAHATVKDGGPQDCGNPDGVVSAFDTHNASVWSDRYLGTGHAHVHLSWGISGSGSKEQQVFWARVTKAPRGTSVWLDWATNEFPHTAGHRQCGYWTVDGSQGPHDRWTWAINSSFPPYNGLIHGFRACGQAPGQKIVCTPWSDDPHER